MDGGRAFGWMEVGGSTQVAKLRRAKEVGGSPQEETIQVDACEKNERGWGVLTRRKQEGFRLWSWLGPSPSQVILNFLGWECYSFVPCMTGFISLYLGIY